MNPRLTIRKALRTDCHAIAPRLREEDAKELLLSSGKEPIESLLDSFSFSSETFVAEEDGQVIAIWGFGTFIYEEAGKKTLVGVPWMVGTPEMMKHPVTIVAAGRVAVDRWESQCDCLCNLTHVENTVHHRWLRHLGFQFMPDVVPTGPSKAPFLQFYRYKINV